MKKNKVWYVKEWDEREETIHTEFPTYESAKKYFDHMIILTIKEWRNEGFEPDEINEYLDRLRQEGFIELNRTAGLDMVYISKKLSPAEILEIYYTQSETEV